MERAEIENRVAAILAEHLGVDLERIQPDTLIVPEHDDRGKQLFNGAQDLGADSLDVVELVMAIEEEFGVEIPDAVAEPLNTGTVRDLYNMVAGLVL